MDQSRKKSTFLFFNPVDKDEADFYLCNLRLIIDKLRTKLCNEESLLDDIPPEYNLVAVNLTVKIEILDRKLKKVIRYFNTLKKWYIETNTPYPGSSEEQKRKELIKAYVSEIRKKYRVTAPVSGKDLPVGAKGKLKQNTGEKYELSDKDREIQILTNELGVTRKHFLVLRKRFQAQRRKLNETTDNDFIKFADKYRFNNGKLNKTKVAEFFGVSADTINREIEERRKINWIIDKPLSKEELSKVYKHHEDKNPSK